MSPEVGGAVYNAFLDSKFAQTGPNGHPVCQRFRLHHAVGTQTVSPVTQAQTVYAGAMPAVNRECPPPRGGQLTGILGPICHLRMSNKHMLLSKR